MSSEVERFRVRSYVVLWALVALLAIAVMAVLRAFDYEACAVRVSADALRTVALTRWHELSLKPDDPYVKDYANGIAGTVVAPDGKPLVGASVSIFDALDFALARGGEAHNRFPADVVVRNASTDDSGSILLSDIPYGNKTLIIKHERTAPMRIFDVLVADGVPTSLGVLSTLPPETRTLSIETDVGRWTSYIPVYAGVWTDERITIEPDQRQLILERRDPDGLPGAVVLFDTQGRKQILRIDWAAEATEPCLALNKGSWSVDPRRRFPELARVSPFIPLSLAISEGAETPSSGAVKIQAPLGFSRILLTTSAGVRYEAWADAFGEAEISAVPPGRHMVTASTLDRLWVPLQGITVSSGQCARLSMPFRDPRSAWVRQRKSLGAFVTTPDGRPVEGAKLLVGSAPGVEPPALHRLETDAQGFCRVDNLTPEGRYRVTVSLDSNDGDIQTSKLITCATRDVSEPDIVYFEVFPHCAHMDIPDWITLPCDVVINDFTTKRFVWRARASNRRITFTNIPPATYVGEILMGTVCVARSQAFTIQDESACITVGDDTWEGVIHKHE